VHVGRAQCYNRAENLQISILIPEAAYGQYTTVRLANAWGARAPCIEAWSSIFPVSRYLSKFQTLLKASFKLS